MDADYTGCLCKSNFRQFDWMVYFRSEQASFFQCVSLGLFCATFEIKKKMNQVFWVNKVLNCFKGVEQFAIEQKLNLNVFFEFAKVFQTILFERSLSQAFSYLRYYIENTSLHSSIVFEYGIRFIIAIKYRRRTISDQILHGNLLNDWQQGLNYVSRKLFIRFEVFEASDIKIIENDPSKTVSTCFIFKENQRFSFLFKNDFFADINKIYDINESIWWFNYFTNSLTIPQEEVENYAGTSTENEESSSVLNTNRNQIIITESNSIKCRKRIFLKLFRFICETIEFACPDDERIALYFSKHNIVDKYIHIIQMRVFFNHFLPNVSYYTKTIIEIANQIHELYGSTPLSKKILEQVFKKIGITQDSGELEKSIFIQALQYLISSHIKKMIYDYSNQ